MEASTTTAGFTFAAATEAELAEFRRVRENLPRMMADWRAYAAGPVFARHVHNLQCSHERNADAVTLLEDAFAAGAAAMFAQAISEARAGTPADPVFRPAEIERHAVDWYLGILQAFSRQFALHADEIRGTFLRGEIWDQPWTNAEQVGRNLRESHLRLARGKNALSVCAKLILTGLFARLGDGWIPFMAVTLGTRLVQEDLDELPQWVQSNACDWTAGSLRRSLAQQIEMVRRTQQTRKHHRDKCGGAVIRQVEAHLVSLDDLARVDTWAWIAIAHLEQDNQRLHLEHGLSVDSPVGDCPERVLPRSSFWQFLLAGAGAVPTALLGEGLARFVLSPRTLPRWAVPGSSPAGNLKHVLRELSDLAVGDVRETVQFRHLAARVQSRDATLAERLALLGQFLAFAFERTQPADTKLRATVERLLHATLRDTEAVLANADCMLCPERLQSPDDVAFDALVAAEAEEARRANDEFQRWIAEALRPENAAAGAGLSGGTDGDDDGADLPPEEPVALRYVENLGAEQWRLRDFVSARERLGGDLERFLDEHGIESVVPARSVAEALRHFLYDLTPEQRRELPLEKIAGTGWRKMKRGGQRLYVLERDGTVYFHLLKRRDWVHADLLAARY
ncbi:MAG: hypothetical protein QM691_17630 [Opitutaceae bacterium]